MEVLDYTLSSKGAVVGGAVKQAENPNQFTYILADGSTENLHVYSSEENESWINHRDNGEVLNMDASLISRLLGKKKAKA